MVEFADRLERLPQPVIIAQPAAHLANLFAAQAKLAGASTRIADRQNREWMPLAAGASRAAASVADGPLQELAAQDLAGDGELADERLVRLDDLISCHLKR